MNLENQLRRIYGSEKFDRQTMAAIYKLHFPEIYRYVRYRVADDLAAEDIASDVFVRLLEAIEKQTEPNTNIRNWLLSTASNAVNDHLRREYRRPTESLVESMHDEDANIQDQVTMHEQTRFFRFAFAKLTPEQQHVLALRFGLGYSLEETAAALNTKSNTVKGLQFRALSSLKRHIGGMGYE